MVPAWDGCAPGWADEFCAGGSGFLQACPSDKGACLPAVSRCLLAFPPPRRFLLVRIVLPALAQPPPRLLLV
jgi:hypothetical protein